jgi:hypothetical protein
MDVRTDAERRLDLHNVNTDFAAATAGRCGFTHLDSGRVCLLPHRHRGPCQLQDRHQAAKRAAGSLLD